VNWNPLSSTFFLPLGVIILKTLKEFFRSAQNSGILLFFCVILSLLIANSPLSESFQEFLDQQIGFNSDKIHLLYPVSLWINDGLMAIFFLMIGLEIKREFLDGELSSPQKAAIPIFAALGGMLVPALIYMLINSGSDTLPGWGIPMATDIAFALAMISLLGKRIPASLKVFLAALAIADDLGAILVIALFYTNDLHFMQLVYAGSIVTVLLIMNFAGVKKMIFYLIPGILLWYFIHNSGVHATIAGVLLAFCIPADPGKHQSALEKLEHILLKPVNWFIMPLFALANTNIRFEKTMLEGLTDPLSLGVIAGLVLGKPIGITLFSWASVKAGFGSLPSNSGWNHIAGVGMLAGIGFTMSVFISMLSFPEPEYQVEAKFSILFASVLSGIIGYTFLRVISKRK
jgi:NhaA family Na+:H+ antiporter